MIVTCESCSTRFNLNDEFVKPTGSRVRCSKCQKVFTVYPPITEELPLALPTETADINLELSSIPPVFEFPQLNENDAQKIALSEHPSETPSFPKGFLDKTEYDFTEIDKLIQSDKNEISASAFDIASDIDKSALALDMSEDDLLILPEDPALDTKTVSSESKPQEVSLDEFEKSLDMNFSDISLISPADEGAAPDPEMDVAETAIGKSLKAKGDLFYEDEIGGLNDIEALDLTDIETLLEKQDAGKLSTSLTAGTESFNRSDSLIVPASSDTETDTTLRMDDQYLTFDELHLDKDESESATLQEVKESFSPAVEIHEPSSGPSLQKKFDSQKTGSGAKEKPFSTDAVVEEEPEETQSEPKKGISPLIIIALILAVIAGLIYGGYYLLNSVGINIPFISKPAPSKIQDPGNFNIKPFDISSRFVDNTKFGKFFIISGKVKNEYPTARGSIQVTGKLYTKDNAMAKAETVYCGNILSDIDLANAELATIQERLQNQSGDNGANLKIAPGDAISFMIVFSNLPDNLEEFTLEVKSSVQI